MCACRNRLVVGTRQVDVVVVHSGIKLAFIALSRGSYILLMQIILLIFQLLYVNTRHNFVLFRIAIRRILRVSLTCMAIVFMRHT